MLLYRAANLAETAGIPEYFIEEVGQLQLVRPFLRMTLCATAEIGGTRFLVPKCEIIRTVESVLRTAEEMRKLLAAERIVVLPVPARAHH